VSVPAQTQAYRPADVVAGFLATLAIVGGSLAFVYRPIRIAPFAILLALIAAAMSARNSRLAAIALAVAALGFVVGTTIAIVTNNPVF
jgi:hypothetical protein